MNRGIREQPGPQPVGERDRFGPVALLGTAFAAAMVAVLISEHGIPGGAAPNWVSALLFSGLAAALLTVLVGSVHHLVVPGRDLATSLAVQTALHLRFAEARHDSFWQHTPDSLFSVEVGGDGRLMFSGINPAHQRLTGLSAARIVGRTPEECLPSDVATAVTANYRECIRRGTAMTYVETLELPGGSRHWRTSLVPVRHPLTGRIVLIFGSTRDITADREAHAELTRLNAQLSSVLSSVSDCYCTFDRDYRLTAANTAALQWIGLDERDIGTSFRHVFDTTAPCGAAMIRAMERGEVVHDELPSAMRPGRWLDYHIYPSGDGVSLFFRDVTEERTIREALREVPRQILASQEGERKRIAAELHDSTTQHVTASLGLMRLPSPADPTEQQVRDEIEGSLNDALQELRVFTYLLHPPSLHRSGLVASLTGFVDGFGRRTGLSATLLASPRLDELQGELQQAVFRVVQEALSNTYRHARATRVLVRARLVRGALFLRISDDGHGMPVARSGPVSIEDTPAGVGLPGMRARLRQFGGDLKVKSGGSGTSLMAMVPLAQNAPNRLIAA